MPNGDEYRDERGGQDEYKPNIYGSSQDTSQQEAVLGGTTQYGIESLSMEQFFTPSGYPLPLEQIVALIKKHKPELNETAIRNRVKDFLPKLQKISKEKAGFLGEEKKLAEKKAKDAYGLTTRAAERGLGTALGESQKQASSLGGAMRGAYGGGSMGMRGAIGGQQSLAKGVESTYGGYQDKMIGAQQALGYADTQADLTHRKGMYGLKEDVKGEFEADVGTFLENFKQGGRVPNKKETFLEVLSRIPDAGGS